jgi:ATP phosphoribosyltransferase
VARVYNVEEEDWFNVSLLVPKEHLLEAVDHLRNCGAVDVAASQLIYLFYGHSQAYKSLFGEGSTGGE